MSTAFALFALALAQGGSDRCADAIDQSAITLCTAGEFEAADEELNRTWKDVLADAREEDRALEGSDDRRPMSETTLRQAQRAWIGYRDANCTYESYETRGGSMELQLYHSCRARMTRERIAQLRDAR